MNFQTHTPKFVECYRCKSRLLSIEASFHGIRKHRGSVVGCENTRGFAKAFNGVWLVSFEQDEIVASSQIGLTTIMDEQSLDTFQRNELEARQRYKMLVEPVALESVSEWSESKMAEHFEQIFEAYSDYLAFYRFTNEEFGLEAESLIRNLLEEHGGGQDEYEILLKPSLKGTAIEREKNDWKILLKTSAGLSLKRVQERIAIHAQEYAFLLGDSGSSFDQAISIFMSRYQRDQELGNSHELHQVVPSDTLLRKDILLRLRLNDDEITLVERIRFLSRLRLEMRENFMRCNYLSKTFFEQIHKRVSGSLGHFLDSSLARMLSSQDILAFLSGSGDINPKVLERRKSEVSCMLMFDSVVIWDTYDILDRRKLFWHKESRVQAAKKTSSVYGQVVFSRGIIEGVAYCLPKNGVLSANEVNRLGKNTILIVSTVHPDVIVLSVNLLGIIADEGGILSHAGIIARELEIPCIVGTGNATVVFETGDRIHLDSYIGYAKLISRSQSSTTNRHLAASPSIFSKQEMMPEILGINWLGSLSETVLDKVGNKSRNLNRFMNHFPVPSGVCLTSDFCEQLVDWKGLKAKVEFLLNPLIKTSDNEQLNWFSLYVRDWILKRKEEVVFSKKLRRAVESLSPCIVRSSSCEEDTLKLSFAGLLQSVMEVSDMQAFADAVFQIIASALSISHLKYRYHYGLEIMPPCPAILIQKMIDARTSGVIFSIDPVTNNKNILVIQSSPSLNSSISDIAKEDNIFVDKKTLRVQRVVQGVNNTVDHVTTGNMMKAQRSPLDIHKCCLNTSEITHLAQMALTLKSIAKEELNIEWCFAPDGRCYLLQARSITSDLNQIVGGSYLNE